ncbi:flagellar basal body-associated FliL family protein [Mesorhizobium sp. CAU 1741]|uniref:flagellar basal body-associated FliL family protein n=1 Tax=Mesorhizobium sp. CAU 1741 TaxID=3140366 RepID=UPI00325AC1EE
MTIVDDTAPPPKAGPSLLLQIALLLGLTVVAIGIGWGSGMYLSSSQPAPEEAEAAESHAAPEVDLANAEAREGLGVVYLEPITTNMAGAGSSWIRLELALVFDGPTDLQLAQNIHQDILAYLRTVKMRQVDGASGFQHLRSDIQERADIRSQGRVKEVLIRTLLFE